VFFCFQGYQTLQLETMKVKVPFPDEWWCCWH